MPVVSPALRPRFGSVPDPRSRRGRWYSLTLILLAWASSGAVVTLAQVEVGARRPIMAPASSLMPDRCQTRASHLRLQDGRYPVSDFIADAFAIGRSSFRRSQETEDHSTGLPCAHTAEQPESARDEIKFDDP